MVPRLSKPLCHCKVGDTFITPSGVHGVVTEITKSGNARIKWDGVKKVAVIDKTDLHKALKKRLIEYIGNSYFML